MEIERRDGTKEKRFYGTPKEMMGDAEKEAKDPNTKKLTLHFPKLTIPKKKQ